MTTKRLTDLLAASDIERFCSLFLKAGGSDPAYWSVLFKEACLYASASLCPQKYPAPHYFVPHSYMGLIAGWQLREYLKESDWWRLLLQALWHVASEAKRWGIANGEPVAETSVSRCTLPAALSEAWASGDFRTFYSLYVACQRQPELARIAATTLLATALRDHTNIGHKFIYVVKAVQLSQYTGWREPLIFYAPIHFMVVAPRDLGISLAAESQLEPFKGRLSGFATNQKTMDYARIIQVRDAIIYGREDTLQLLVELLTRGYSVESIAEGLLLIASHLVYYAPTHDLKRWWLYPVHGFSFSQSVNYGLNFLEPYDKVLALLINGLYLQEVVRAIGEIAVDESIASVNGATKASLEQLGGAVENGDVVEAVNQVKGLIAGQVSFPRLAEKLVLLAARNEGFLFTHVAKHLYYVLHSLKNSTSPWSNEHLISFVKFLTLTTKKRELVKVAEEIARLAND